MAKPPRICRTINDRLAWYSCPPIRNVVPAVAARLRSLDYFIGDLCELVAEYVALPPERFDEMWMQLFPGLALYRDAGAIGKELSTAACIRIECQSNGVCCVSTKNHLWAALDANLPEDARLSIRRVVENVGYPIAYSGLEEPWMVVLVSL
jgi:hypothetical protein